MAVFSDTATKSSKNLNALGYPHKTIHRPWKCGLGHVILWADEICLYLDHLKDSLVPFWTVRRLEKTEQCAAGKSRESLWKKRGWGMQWFSREWGMFYIEMVAWKIAVTVRWELGVSTQRALSFTREQPQSGYTMKNRNEIHFLNTCPVS